MYMQILCSYLAVMLANSPHLGPCSFHVVHFNVLCYPEILTTPGSFPSAPIAPKVDLLLLQPLLLPRRHATSMQLPISNIVDLQIPCSFHAVPSQPTVHSYHASTCSFLAEFPPLSLVASVQCPINLQCIGIMQRRAAT